MHRHQSKAPFNLLTLAITTISPFLLTTANPLYSSQTYPLPDPGFDPAGYSRILPNSTVIYNVDTGAIDCTTGYGVVSKFPPTAQSRHPYSTLITFVYPPESEGKRCQLSFLRDYTTYTAGTGQIDVFSTLAPPPATCPAEWPPGNRRNNQLGRLRVNNLEYSPWEWVTTANLTTLTPCRPVGTVESFEYVGVGDTDYVRWDPKSADRSGPRILIVQNV